MYFIPYCYSKYQNLISFYTKSCGCTTPELLKKYFTTKGEQSLDSSSSACPYHSAMKHPAFGLVLGAPEPCLQHEGVPVQGTVRGKLCSPVALSEAETGNFTCGNCQGVLHLPQTGTGKGNQGIFPSPWSKWCHLPHLKRQTSWLKQRAQEAAASGCCCFSHRCLSAPCRYPFFFGNAAGPLCLLSAFGCPRDSMEEHITVGSVPQAGCGGTQCHSTY